MDVFVDTGNSCTEPLSGAPVHFVSLKAMEDYIPEDLMKPLLLWDPTDSPAFQISRADYQKDMRLVRLTTVQGQSWAIGFKFERVVD